MPKHSYILFNFGPTLAHSISELLSRRGGCMQKLKIQIEGQLQEIVFFFSLLLSFSVFISGVFFLALTPESVVYMLGNFGSAMNQLMFTTFGYGFFYFAIIALHMGYVTNFHIFSFKDIKREYPVLAYSLIAHLIILSMLATLLAVIQIYLEIPSGEVLNRGAGGILGNAFGQLVYSGLGIYGSIILVVIASIVTAIMAGFFQLPDILAVIKEASIQTKHATIDGARALNESLSNSAHFLMRNSKVATVHAGATSKQLMIESFHKANSFVTEKVNAYVSSIEEQPKKKTSRKVTTKKPAIKNLKKENDVPAKKTAKASTTKPVVAERKAKKKLSTKKSNKNS
jgi:hypothetical protein